MKALNQRGQSTIEFIFTFVFGVSVILVIFNGAMNHATGYLVHYATFMASRSYLTGDNYLGTFGGAEVDGFQSQAEARAREVFNQYNLGIFKIDPNGFKVNHASGGMPISHYLTVGTLTVFEQPIDVVGRVAGQSKLFLESQSYLGKEPTRFSCALQMCRAVTAGESCRADMDVTLFDDGC